MAEELQRLITELEAELKENPNQEDEITLMHLKMGLSWQQLKPKEMPPEKRMKPPRGSLIYPVASDRPLAAE